MPVQGKTLEAALEVGRSLKWSDVAEFDGDVMDANITVIGAYDPNGSSKLDA
jgi:hypothetical protein